MQKYVILLLLIITTISINSQEKKKSFWKILKGKPLETSISFLPIGNHVNPIDFLDTWLTAFIYKSVEVSAFKNSVDDLTVATMYKREIVMSEKWSFIYGLGIMYGYDGILVDVPGIPFRKTFLFQGPINPITSFTFDYRVAKKFSLQASISPAVFVYGVRFIL
ncbi:MAG: hypothetical protein ACJA1B_001918 [Polaribacter sp.]|jgi:hypothetical protein